MNKFIIICTDNENFGFLRKRSDFGSTFCVFIGEVRFFLQSEKEYGIMEKKTNTIVKEMQK